MEIPDNSSWIDNSLLCPEPQQEVGGQHHPHALYATDLPPLSQSAEHGQPHMFGQPFHQSMVGNFDDGSGLQHAAEFHHCQELHTPQFPTEQPGLRPGSSANEAGDLASARRVHKADREKLRRDKLNEQFTELASALDPDRPKNDKATILSDSVQELNELRAEVKRLKAEHAALLDESRDLTQEKSELREEKALLKSETEQLQAQLQQRLRLALPWTAMDPSLMMGAAAFPYPVPVPAPSGPPASSQQQPSSMQNGQMPPIMPPSPFLPPPGLPLPPPGAFAMHPSLQAYAMFANRPAGGSMPFFPYTHYPHGLVGSNSSVERPYPQYPSPLHPIRGYGQEGSQPTFFSQALGEPPYKPAFVPAASSQVASKSREENAQPTEVQLQTDSTQASGESTAPQAEGSPSKGLEVKQEVRSFVKGVTLSPLREGSGDSNCSPSRGVSLESPEIQKHARAYDPSIRPAAA